MGTAMPIVSAVMDVYGQNASLTAQARANAKQAQNVITSMNFSMQNLERERSDAFDATIAELQKIHLNGERLTKQVEAAVNEGLAGGGRTADLIKRSARADVVRASQSIKDNYQRKSNEVDLNKEAQLLQAKRQTESIPQIEKPSFLNTVLRLGVSYYNAAKTADSIQGIRNSAGIDGSGGSAKINSFSTAGDYNLATKTYTPYLNTAPDYNKILGGTDWLSKNSFNFQYKNPYESTFQSKSYF